MIKVETTQYKVVKHESNVFLISGQFNQYWVIGETKNILISIKATRTLVLQIRIRKKTGSASIVNLLFSLTKT